MSILTFKTKQAAIQRLIAEATLQHHRPNKYQPAVYYATDFEAGKPTYSAQPIPNTKLWGIYKEHNFVEGFRDIDDGWCGETLGRLVQRSTI